MYFKNKILCQKCKKIYILARDSKTLTVPVKPTSRTPDPGVK